MDFDSTLSGSGGCRSLWAWDLVRRAIVALPKIASESIPSIIAYANSHGVELPFTDLDSLKAAVMDMMKDEFQFVGHFARTASKELIFVIVGIVVAVSMYLNPGVEKDGSRPKKSEPVHGRNRRDCSAISDFLRKLRNGHGRAVNHFHHQHGLDEHFVLIISLKHASVVIGLTFLCGWSRLWGTS